MTSAFTPTRREALALGTAAAMVSPVGALGRTADDLADLLTLQHLRTAQNPRSGTR